VAPSGPVSASEAGLVLVDKQARVAQAKRGPLPTSSGPAKGSFSVLDRPRDDFVFGQRGPAIVAGFAYWTHQGNLVRARVGGAPGEPEVLAKDARKGARVVASEGPDRQPLIGYIGAPDASGAPHAKLWSAGKIYELTPEGAGASSMALVAVPSGWLAITLDGRSGMTPLHARKVTRSPAGVVTVGPDVVVWVGASAQATTEVFATETDGDVWAFIPIEQDVTHFGLAQVHIGTEPRLDAQVRFLTYANGTNSAPVAAASVCGRGAVAFAEPESADPQAKVRLMLAVLGRDGLEAPEIVATGAAFAHLSLAEIPLGPPGPGGVGSSLAGGLLAYTANHRSWARTLRCRAPGAVRADLPGGSEKR